MIKRELERTLAALTRVREEHNTREKALALLVEAGIATQDGKLAAHYRNYD